MAKRKLKRKCPWKRVTKKGHKVACHRTKKAAKKARKKGQRVVRG